MTERYVCIHGHFYQPPRENPWLEEVELQDSAHPYHDWNERITAECYAPNTASRIVDGENRIIDLVNNYSKMSFNIGPTLCSWMERHKPEVLQAIVDADKKSRERYSGHGSAIAQVYNHMIMPLANKRDKYTQAHWGIVDFEKRFGRFPEGMWLPETAVDIETLEVLAELNVKFIVLAPRQARRVKQILKGARWHDVRGGIDPTTGYLCSLPSGKSITLFFYDGPISQAMAFEGLLRNGEVFAQRLLGAFREERAWPQLVHVATDGESYGHHHRHGDMALSYCLHYIESAESVQLTNYGEFIERHPPTHFVEVFENSSWSCVHGVERWRDNCGCNSGRQGWTQAWRKPLREALDKLRDTLVPLYEEDASKYLKDPWRTRDCYIEVILDRSRENVSRFLSQHAVRELSNDETVRVLRLTELQRNCMLMYTSCGWFFDEISGIETTQVLQYAVKAVQEVSELFDVPVEQEFIDRLAAAPSNVLKNGAQAYSQYAKPASVDLLRVGAHYGIFSLFSEHRPKTYLHSYSVDSESYKKLEVGRFKLATGNVKIASVLTWEENRVCFAVIHLGDHNVSGGVRVFVGDKEFAQMQNDVAAEFEKGNIGEVIKLMVTHFGTNNYSLWHLFKDEQRQVLLDILKNKVDEVSLSFRQIYQDNYPVMTFLQSIRNALPAPFVAVAEDVINDDLLRVFDDDEFDNKRVEQAINEVKKWSLRLRKDDLQFKASGWVNAQIQKLADNPQDATLLERIDRSLKSLDPLHLDLDFWKAQNIYFSLTKGYYAETKERAQTGDSAAKQWVALFSNLGSYLHVKVE